MIRQQTYWLAVATLVLLALASATASSPQVISHQGYLTSHEGIALTGTHSLTFGIYDVASGGAPIWTETHATVEVADGLYSLLLGSISPLTADQFAGPSRYLGISIDGGAELTPRRQIAATAFALRSDRAANADSLNGLAPSFYLSWGNLSGIPAGFADGVDNVGTGDITGVTAGDGLMGGGTSGTVQLDLDTAGVASKHIADGTIMNVDVNASAAIAVTKISGTAVNLSSAQTISGDKTFGSDLYVGDSTMHANLSGVLIGTRSFNPSLSYLLYISRNFNTTAARYGLYSTLENYSTGSVYAVRAFAGSATSGAANAGNVYALYGQALSDGALRYGIYSFARPRTSTLTTGESYGIKTVAQYGHQAYGARFEAAYATIGQGVYCEVYNNDYGNGVYSYVHNNTASSSSIGTNNNVSSNGGNAFGIAATVGNNEGIGYAVHGYAYGNATNWAGFFAGDVNVTGTLFMPAKITKIDHPLDPENQNLLLSGIDSPEMLVKSSGNVTTDATGTAIVTLPAYFTAITASFRYQLTVIGEFAQAIIGQEVTGTQFSIKTDKPGIKVSWEITGERNDNYAKAHRIINESIKPAEHRGRYLHPEAFGLAIERGVDYLITEELAKATPKRSQATQPDETE